MVKTRRRECTKLTCKYKRKIKRLPQKARRRGTTNCATTIQNVVPGIKYKNRIRDLPSDHITRFQSSTGPNYYNRNKQKPTDKRMVLIDGSNVAYAYTNHRGFSGEGLAIAIRFFEKNGFEVKAIIPDFRLNEGNEMTQLNADNKLILTPSKNLPGKRASSYDDRILLQLACEYDAAVVSNDNFRDIIYESTDFRKIIESQVINYVFCKDMFLVPVDPYGRDGPSLANILYRRN